MIQFDQYFSNALQPPTSTVTSPSLGILLTFLLQEVSQTLQKHQVLSGKKTTGCWGWNPHFLTQKTYVLTPHFFGRVPYWCWSLQEAALFSMVPVSNSLLFFSQTRPNEATVFSKHVSFLVFFSFQISPLNGLKLFNFNGCFFLVYSQVMVVLCAIGSINSYCFHITGA